MTTPGPGGAVIQDRYGVRHEVDPLLVPTDTTIEMEVRYD